MLSICYGRAYEASTGAARAKRAPRATCELRGVGQLTHHSRILGESLVAQHLHVHVRLVCAPM